MDLEKRKATERIDFINKCQMRIHSILNPAANEKRLSEEEVDAIVGKMKRDVRVFDSQVLKEFDRLAETQRKRLVHEWEGVLRACSAKDDKTLMKLLRIIEVLLE